MEMLGDSVIPWRCWGGGNSVEVLGESVIPLRCWGTV